MTQYMVEITDLFAGEPNYSYVIRHKVKAKSPMGAIRKINRLGGVQFKREFDYGDWVRYKSKSGATCAFIEQWQDESHGNLSGMNKDLSK